VGDTMTGRPETPLPLDAPAELLRLAAHLRKAREQSGISYRKMAERANYSPPALSQAAGGKKVPSWDVTHAYLTACGVYPGADVKLLWDAAVEEMRRLRRTRQRTGHGAAGQGSDELGPAYGDIDLNVITDLREYADALARVREEAGLSVRQLIEQSQTIESPDSGTATAGKVMQLKRSTIYDVTNNKTIRPSPEFTALYLRACALTDGQVTRWIDYLKSLHEAHRRITAAFKLLTDPTSPRVLVAEDEQEVDEHVKQIADEIRVERLRPISTPPAPTGQVLEERPLLSHESVTHRSMTLFIATTGTTAANETPLDAGAALTADETTSGSPRTLSQDEHVVPTDRAPVTIDGTATLDDDRELAPAPRTHRRGAAPRPSYGKPPAIQLQWRGKRGEVRISVDRDMANSIIRLCALIVALITIWVLAR
jgi:transcriptional regulator with XRE-family HTH domain